MVRILLLIAALLGLAVPASCDDAVAKSPTFEEVRSAYLESDFEKLDRWTIALRDGSAVTKHGQPSLERVYVTIFNPTYLYGEASPKAYDEMDRHVARWLAAYPQSIAAQILKGEILKQRAWLLRGNGFINSVTPDGLKGFLQYSNQARELLATVKDRASADPQWYATMLDISLGIGLDDEAFAKLADEALAAHPKYLPILTQIIRKQLTKWGGSRESLDFWIRRIADSVPAGEGDAYYTRSYWLASNHYDQHEIFSPTDVDWDRMKAGFEAIVASYPTNWNLNNFASFACMAQDRATTKPLMMRLGDAIDWAAWEDHEMPKFCRELADTPQPVMPPDVYLVEAYQWNQNGNLMQSAGPIERKDADAAVATAKELAATNAGVVAYRLTGNRYTGSYRRPQVLYQSGEAMKR